MHVILACLVYDLMTFCLALWRGEPFERFGTGVVLGGSVSHEAVSPPAAVMAGRQWPSEADKKENKKTGGQNHDVS